MSRACPRCSPWAATVCYCKAPSPAPRPAHSLTPDHPKANCCSAARASGWPTPALGEAQAAPGAEQALSNLLNIIGRRDGAPPHFFGLIRYAFAILLRPAWAPIHARFCYCLIAACACLVSPGQIHAQTSITPGTAVRAEPVTLNFVGAEIEAVARTMATISGRNVVVDPRVKGHAESGHRSACTHGPGLRPIPRRAALCKALRWWKPQVCTKSPEADAKPQNRQCGRLARRRHQQRWCAPGRADRDANFQTLNFEKTPTTWCPCCAR